jgi:hypothetical protein
MNGQNDELLHKSPIIKARPSGRNWRGGAARSGRGKTWLKGEGCDVTVF